MADQSDGGPAFPLPFVQSEDRDGYVTYTTAADIDHGGLSLRDYFAAKAMANINIRAGSPEKFNDEEWMKWWEWSARNAYLQADAMLKARETT